MIVLPSFSYFSTFFSKEGEQENIVKQIPTKNNFVHVDSSCTLLFNRHFMAPYPISPGALLMVKLIILLNLLQHKSAKYYILRRKHGSGKPIGKQRV